MCGTEHPPQDKHRGPGKVIHLPTDPWAPPGGATHNPHTYAHTYKHTYTRARDCSQASPSRPAEDGNGGSVPKGARQV